MMVADTLDDRFASKKDAAAAAASTTATAATQAAIKPRARKLILSSEWSTSALVWCDVFCGMVLTAMCCVV
jgi:hypothetical protein